MFPLAEDESTRLLHLEAYKIAGTEAETRFDHIAELAATLFSTPIAAITLIDVDKVWLKARVGLDACEVPRDVGFCAHAIMSGSPMVIPDLSRDERFAQNPLVVSGPRLRFYAGAPLTIASGHRLGTVCIMDYEPRAALLEKQEAQLATIAELVVDHLEARRLGLTNGIARGFADASQDGMMCIDSRGVITFANQASLDLFGYTADEMIGQTLDLIMPERFRSAHAGGVARIAGGAPSKLHGKAVELSALRRSGEEFTIEISICSWRDRNGTHMGASLRDISERKQRDLRLHRLAHHDPLTGLANRLRLEEALASSFAASAPVAVLLLDLDRFKILNDSLGHAAGDVLLQTFAVRLQSALDADAIPVRMGGDEFAIVLPGVADPLRVCGCANALISTVEAPFRISGHNVSVAISIGAAIGPLHGRDGEELIASADLALYRAKAEAGSCFRLYEAFMRNEVAARRALQDEMLHAFESRQFVLHYQPQVCLSTKRLVGVEALLRWQHPERGLLLPGSFIKVLDEHMLALDIGEWIIDEACRQAAMWRDAGFGPLRMAVNLFKAQLSSGRLVSHTTAALSRHKLRPFDLELEITERIALQNDERALAPLRDLRTLGVGLAFDDFGTGFASLSTLKRVPLTTLKIDRSFVRDILDNPHDAAIVAAMVDMGHRLDLTVVAEGVETVEQEHRLIELGCLVGQGFHYGRPASATELDLRWGASKLVQHTA